MILRGQEACDMTGIPSLHAQAFQEVANETNTVIASRAVGIYATDLILEGYASKGFHNKAKSCNWGPMAGFVLDDPRFTKVGATDAGITTQANALREAVNHNAVEVPLYISDRRRTWLLSKGLMTLVDLETDCCYVRAVSPWGLSLDFKLVPERPQGANENMWGVLYRSADRQSARLLPVANGGWTPVMAMRDPLCVIPATDYRAATTGDYDLFAAWASNAEYCPDVTDRRRVGHKALEDAIRARANDTGEHRHQGNITPRLDMLSLRLNRAFTCKGYTGGNMVHHSDEDGRRFVRDIDLPIFAVVPGETKCYCLQEVADLREFINNVLDRRYAPVFNPGWMNQLVFGNNGEALKRDLLAARGRPFRVGQINAIRTR